MYNADIFTSMPNSAITYTITDQTLKSIANLERNLTILNQNEISFRSKYKIYSQALFDDLYAINNFFNLNLTLGDIKKISIGKDVDTKEAKLLQNIKQIYDYVQNNNVKTEITFNFYFIQHIIKLIQTHILEDWDIGKIRDGESKGDPYLELLNQNYFNGNINSILAESIMWVEENQDLHPIIKSCVFFVLINQLSPFVGLNFLSSIVFFRLVLEKYGYGRNLTIPLFKILTKSKEKFLEIMENVSSSQNDITDLINLISSSLDEVIEAYKKELVEFDYFEIRNNSEKLNFNNRQLKLLKLLQQKISIKRNEYMKLFKVSPMTAYRDLNGLLSRKLVIISGQGKSTKYTLVSKATSL